ncbi:MAG: TetR/AcrR family transcriptional regulator, partial [Thermodesulfobacteriota bacterium]
DEMTQIFEEILLKGSKDGEFAIDKKDIRLIAHNIMVLGQMWAFRRWVIQKNYTLERYTEIQTSSILSRINPDHKNSD